MIWTQNYDPLAWPLLSTLMAALPVVVLLSGIGFFHLRAHIAAICGLVTALIVAIAGFGMPAHLAVRSAAFGAAYGLLPIGWIILNIIFLYQLANERGQFEIMRESIARITGDARLQLLLVAFCFGAFFEGAAGFGAPVAVTGAMLIGLGFTRLQASCLSLIANTAPVAFGALGTPIVTLAAVTGLSVSELSETIGRQMVPFALIVPCWLLVAYCGVRRTIEVWPAVVVVGVVFSAAQLAVSNLHGPWLTAVVAAIVSIGALMLLLKFWHPRRAMAVGEAERSRHDESAMGAAAATADGAVRPHVAPAAPDVRAVRLAWTPWIILTGLVFLWGLPSTKTLLDSIFKLAIPFADLHNIIQRVPPVVATPALDPAIYNLSPLSATGSAILLAGVISGLLLGASPVQIVRTYGRALRTVLPSLATIAAMLALGYLTRFSGIDATMGLAFAATGVMYPFFGTLLGWLGVAVTGSDTASNVLFGGLQRVTAEQLGLSPVLMASANSSGGVMGKMIDAQSIVVASTATQWFGQESRILRFVFFHSLALGSLVGLTVMLQAYVWPFTLLVP